MATYFDGVLFDVLLALHVAGGGLGLLAGTFVLLRQKGDQLHRRVGSAFTAGMLAAGVTSLLMAVLHPSVFLFIVGVFTLYLVGTGLRYNRLRGLKGEQRPATIDYLLSGAMAVFGLGFLGYGAYMLAQGSSMGTVLLVFGVISLLMVAQDARNYRGRARSPKYWLLMHIARMTGGYIAAFTAFLAVNIDFFPRAVPGFVVWLAPTALFVPLIVYYSRRVRLGRM